MKTLNCLFLLCAVFPECYAKSRKAGAHISSIYINTPDSSVKASVTDQPGKNVQVGRTYHWYASNQLCVTNGSYSGRLLHGTYSSFYPNHFLLAQGQFRSGLKDGCWKRWLPDGSLHEIIHYKNGQLHGTHEIYSPRGYLMQRIYYRKGARAGKTTIFSQDGKDSVIVYKNGEKRRQATDDRREKKGGDSVQTRVKKNGDSAQTTDGKRQAGQKTQAKKNGDSAQTTDGRRQAGEKAQAKKNGDSVRTKEKKSDSSFWKRKLRIKKRDASVDSTTDEDRKLLSHSRLSSVDSRLQ